MAGVDVAVIGGGVKGAADFYALTYTNVGSVVLIEKYGAPGLVNSNMMNNSQTLHIGDIETNFSLAKALAVRHLAEHTKAYLDRFDDSGALHSVYHKMVLGVGRKEMGVLKARFEQFRQHYPHLQYLGFEAIAELEPKVTEGRESRGISAIFSPRGYAVDYGRLAKSFVDRAVESREGFSARFGTEVATIRREGLEFVVETAKGDVRAKAVIVSAGAQSLLFAKRLGYARNLALLPVAGSFYHARDKLLNGKVYTVQDNDVPLAAIHGDPEAHDASVTRFGPTAKVVPLMERHNYETLDDFVRTGSLGKASLLTFWEVVASPPALRAFMLKNMVYELPVVGKMAFAETVRKIVPTVASKDLVFARNVGGLRPQVMDKVKQELQMGQVKILGENVIFNMTPSPGASVCLGDGFADARTVVGFLGPSFSFDERKYSADFRE